MDLGEGLHISPCGIFWLDIINSKLFFKNANSPTHEFKLPEQASDIWKVMGNRYVFLATESGIAKFDLVTKGWSIIGKLPNNRLSSELRANDGGELKDSYYCFGTMSKNPTNKKDGSIYVFNGTKVFEIYRGISIPNSFIKISKREMLISDSLEKIIYKFTFSEDYLTVISKEIWVDHSQDGIIPDGGCIDRKGNIYVAIWGGFCVNKYDKKGMLLSKIKLNVPHPTNCKLNSDESILFVTTARYGMSEKEVKYHPDSGSVLAVELIKK